MDSQQYSDYVNLAKKSYQIALDSISAVTKDTESDNALELCKKAIMLEPKNINKQKEVVNLLFDITELKINIGTQVQHLFNEMTNKSNEELPLYSENKPLNEAILNYWFKGIEVFDTTLELCPSQKESILDRKVTVLAETLGLMLYTKSDLLRAFSLLDSLVFTIRKNDMYNLDALVEETLYNGGIEAGSHADSLVKNNKETAAYLYDLAKNSLTEAQYRTTEISKSSNPTIAQQFCNNGVTAKSLLSMLVRHFHLDPNLYKQKLDEAKQTFEELNTKYPDTANEMYYNRACIAGIENNVDDALKYLELSRLGGCLPSKYSVQYDRDFNLINGDRKFETWLKTL